MLADHDSQFEGNDLDCAVCGNDRIVVESDGTITCRDCHRSYALVRHEDFALMEIDGWTAGITLDVADEQAPEQ